MAHFTFDHDLAVAKQVAAAAIDTEYAQLPITAVAWQIGSQTQEQLTKELKPADSFVRNFGELDTMPQDGHIDAAAVVTLSAVSWREALDTRIEVLQEVRNRHNMRRRFKDQAERQQLSEQGQEMGKELAQQITTGLSISAATTEHAHVMLLVPTIENRLLHGFIKEVDPVDHRRFTVASEIALQRTLGANPSFQELQGAKTEDITVAGGYKISPGKAILLGFADLIGDNYVKEHKPDATSGFSRMLNSRRLRAPGEAFAHGMGRKFAATVIQSAGMEEFHKVWAQAPPTSQELLKPEMWLSRKRR